MSAHDGSRRPWDAQPGEGSAAFAAFRAYLELGAGRSIPAAAKAVGKSKQQLFRWSPKHQWVQRARAWDAEMARQRDAELVEDRRELVEDRRELKRRRLRRAKEADAVGRALTRVGLRPDQYAGETRLKPADCLRYGERYLRLATEIEDRALSGNEGGESTQSLADELSLLDDPALRRIVEEARRAEQDHEEVNRDESEATDDEASETPSG